jgi:hypothetical protein
MNRRVLTLLAALLFVFAVHPAVTYAQDAATADIGFKFFASGKAMPAGTYELQINSDRSAFTLVPSAKGPSVILAAITRLGAPEAVNTDTRFVFDKVGDAYYLSEVWLPGEDGFLFYAAKEKHTHQIIKAIKKALKK